MQVGIYRRMAVHAVGCIDFRLARRECRMMADNASRGVRRAKLAIREDARREADAFIGEISEEARLADARAEYDAIVADVEDNPEIGEITNPRRDYIQYDLAAAARAAEIPAIVYERDKDRLFGKKCDICGDRGCRYGPLGHRELWVGE